MTDTPAARLQALGEALGEVNREIGERMTEAVRVFNQALRENMNGKSPTR